MPFIAVYIGPKCSMSTANITSFETRDMSFYFKKNYLNNALSERAKAFWKKEDIDDLFNVVFGYLDNLKRVLKKNTATDRGWTLPLFHVSIRTCDQLPAVINKSSCLSTRICSGLKAAGGFELFSVRFKSGLFCGSGGHWFR